MNYILDSLVQFKYTYSNGCVKSDQVTPFMIRRRVGYRDPISRERPISIEFSGISGEDMEAFMMYIGNMAYLALHPIKGLFVQVNGVNIYDVSRLKTQEK